MCRPRARMLMTKPRALTADQVQGFHIPESCSVSGPPNLGDLGETQASHCGRFSPRQRQAPGGTTKQGGLWESTGGAGPGCSRSTFCVALGPLAGWEAAADAGLGRCPEVPAAP